MKIFLKDHSVVDVSAPPWYALGKTIVQGYLPTWFTDKTKNTTKRDPLYASLAEWYKVLDSVRSEIDQRGFPNIELLGLDRTCITNSVLQKLDLKYGVAFSFSKLIKTFLDNEPYSFILPAPKSLHRQWQANEYNVSLFISKILWSALVLKLFFNSLKKSVRLSLGSLREFMKRDLCTLPAIHTLWIGTSPLEMTGDPKKLDIIEFVQTSTIPPLNNRGPLFVQATWLSELKSFPNANAYAGANPFLSFHLTKTRSEAFRHLVSELSEQFVIGLKCIKILVMGTWAEKLLMDDLPTLPRAKRWFKLSQPKQILLSYSLYNNQPLWVSLAKNYGCKSWMLFYHANHDCMAYKDEPAYEECCPIEHFLNVDFVTAWDQLQYDYFIRIGFDPKNIITTGPIIFARTPDFIKKPWLRKNNSDDNIFKIAVFDVAPLKQDVMLKRGVFKHYNRTENILKFHRDIYDAALKTFGENNFQILVKSKRPGKFTNLEYIKFMDEFSQNKIKLLPPETHPYEVILDVDAVISAPFTSTTRVGKAMGIPSCYYDSTGQLQYNHPANIEPQLIQSEMHLINWLEKSKILRKHSNESALNSNTP